GAAEDPVPPCQGNLPGHGGPSCADYPELSAFPVIHALFVVCKVRGWPGPPMQALRQALISTLALSEKVSCTDPAPPRLNVSESLEPLKFTMAWPYRSVTMTSFSE